MSGRYQGAVLHNLFTEQDPAAHREKKLPVSAKYAMASIRALEPLTEKCTEIFLNAMKDLEGQRIDLGEWLQWSVYLQTLRDASNSMVFASCWCVMY